MSTQDSPPAKDTRPLKHEALTPSDEADTALDAPESKSHSSSGRFLVGYGLGAALLVAVITSDYWMVHSNRILEQYWGEPPLPVPLAVQEALLANQQAVDELRVRWQRAETMIGDQQERQHQDEKNLEQQINSLHTQLDDLRAHLAEMAAVTSLPSPQDVSVTEALEVLQHTTGELQQQLEALEKIWLDTFEASQRNDYGWRLGALMASLGGAQSPDQDWVDDLEQLLHRQDRQELGSVLNDLRVPKLDLVLWRDQAITLLMTHKELSLPALSAPAENSTTGKNTMPLELPENQTATQWWQDTFDQVLQYLRGLVTIRQRQPVATSNAEEHNAETESSLSRRNAGALAAQLRALEISDTTPAQMQNIIRRDALLAQWQQHQQRLQATDALQQWYRRTALAGRSGQG